SLELIFDIREGGQHQDGHLMALADAAAHLPSVHSRHEHVEDDDVKGGAVKHLEGLVAACRLFDVKKALEVQREEVPHTGFVTDDQHAVRQRSPPSSCPVIVERVSRAIRAPRRGPRSPASLRAVFGGARTFSWKGRHLGWQRRAGRSLLPALPRSLKASKPGSVMPPVGPQPLL